MMLPQKWQAGASASVGWLVKPLSLGGVAGSAVGGPGSASGSLAGESRNLVANHLKM